MMEGGGEGKILATALHEKFGLSLSGQNYDASMGRGEEADGGLKANLRTRCVDCQIYSHCTSFVSCFDHAY